jgi:hypothetical protein
LSFENFQWLDIETEGVESLIRFLRKDIADRQKGYGAIPMVTTHPATPQEFADSMISNSNIRLSSIDYYLHNIRNGYYENIYFEPVHDGDNIVIRNIENVRIQGSSDGLTRLLVSPQYSNTLNFENCTNLVLENLTLGHSPELGSCIGGVIRLTNCTNITIINSDIFGSGTEGLTIRHVTGLKVVKCVIRDCTYGILSIEDSSDIDLSDCVFQSNKEFYGIGICTSKDIRFSECQIINNTATAESLIAVTSSAKVLFSGGAISGNKAKRLSTNDDRVEIIDCNVGKNDFFADAEEADAGIDPYVGFRAWNVIHMGRRPE